MTTNQLENDWQLPSEFLDCKIYLKHEIPVYTLPDDSIKFFNFQTSVPPETPAEAAERERAEIEQEKMGIIRRVNRQPYSSDNSNTQFHPQLQVSASVPKITVLNGQNIEHTKIQQKPQINLLNEFANKSSFINKPINTFNKKVGRNEPCPCGSGKKYKICHGR